MLKVQPASNNIQFLQIVAAQDLHAQFYHQQRELLHYRSPEFLGNVTERHQLAGAQIYAYRGGLLLACSGIAPIDPKHAHRRYKRRFKAAA